MFIVRGVNVFPLAVAAIVNEFRPDLTGEFRIVLQEAPPIVTPPTLRVEIADALEAERLDRVKEALAARVRGVLVFTPRVEAVPAGTFPRGEQKTRHVLRAWRGEA